MRRRLVSLVTVLFLVGLAPGCGGMNGDESGETVVSALYPSYTDAQLASQAAAVVLGQVTEKDGLYHEETAVFTEFKVRVIRMFKGDLPATFTLTYDGAEEVVFELNPLPEVERTYIFFVREVPETGRLVLVSGPSSRFDLQDGQFVRPTDADRRWTLEEFIRHFGF